MQVVFSRVARLLSPSDTSLGVSTEFPPAAATILGVGACAYVCFLDVCSKKFPSTSIPTFCTQFSLRGVNTTFSNEELHCAATLIDCSSKVSMNLCVAKSMHNWCADSISFQIIPLDCSQPTRQLDVVYSPARTYSFQGLPHGKITRISIECRSQFPSGFSRTLHVSNFKVFSEPCPMNIQHLGKNSAAYPPVIMAFWRFTASV